VEIGGGWWAGRRPWVLDRIGKVWPDWASAAAAFIIYFILLEII